MRLVFTLLLCFAMALSSRAQERVRNVRIRVADSSQLEIRYDLINTRYGDSVYFEVRSRIRGALRISPEFVRGDFGFRITAGSDRRIIWNALANGYSLNEEIQAKVFVKTGITPPPGQQAEPEPVVVQKPAVTTPAPASATPKPAKSDPVAVTESPATSAAPVPQYKKTKRGRPTVVLADSVSRQPTPAAPAPAIVSTPVPQATAPRPEPSVQPTPSSPIMEPLSEPRSVRRRYAGPAWALVSVVAPGIGNIFVQTPKPKIGLRPLVTVGCYGLLIYGFMERQKSNDAYAIYEQQKNMTAGEPYYKTANDHHHTYFMATRGALVVAAADVILTFIKGVRNSQSQKEARRYQSVTISPGFQAGQPTALVRYSF
ncbi:hypothetical protein [Spirosoma radiotolerans]|uniref:DUF5683 domain-containing protein n=1 Tax=Spirosoma radiotolerans TaxID=1379870 RepID=A0A0E3ZW64_9BACT|nr:hypothetical protein [Spirosoma radiotolerans]AKD56455.1 hypothetical protein SD10_17610 [Spirosoma radiotolerans]